MFIKAQKCSFPFTYNSNSYSSCTNTDLSYNWCSPTSTYSGQSLKCDPISKFFSSFIIQIEKTFNFFHLKIKLQ